MVVGALVAADGDVIVGPGALTAAWLLGVIAGFRIGSWGALWLATFWFGVAAVSPDSSMAASLVLAALTVSPIATSALAVGVLAGDVAKSSRSPRHRRPRSPTARRMRPNESPRS